MGILDQIANIGTAGKPGPIAAFLVGRENRRQIERQENRDAQLETRFNQQAELADLQIDAIKDEPARIEAQRQQIEAGIRSKVTDPELADLAVSMANTGDMKGAFELVRDSLNPEIEKLTFQKGDENVTQLVHKRTKEVVRELGTGSRRQQVEQGEPGSFNPLTSSQEGAEEIETRNRLTAAYKVLDSAQSLSDIRAGNRSAGGTAGNIIETVNEFAQAAISIAEVAGVDLSQSDSLLDPSLYQDEFSKFRSTAIASAEAQSAVVSLAFSAAAASSQTGRDVSDKDVARFIREIGGSIDDPKAFDKVIKSFVRRIGKGIEIRDKVAGRADPRTAELMKDINKFVSGNSILGASKPTDVEAPSGVDPAVWQEMTPEERAIWD